MSHKKRRPRQNLHPQTKVDTYIREQPDGTFRVGLSIEFPEGASLEDAATETELIKYITQIRMILGRPGFQVCNMRLPGSDDIVGYACADNDTNAQMTKVFPTPLEAVMEAWKMTIKHNNLKNGDPIPGVPGVLFNEKGFL